MKYIKVKQYQERPHMQDFCFQLTEIEWDFLRSQIATSNMVRGGRRYLPYVFTEHGIVMLANVLKSDIAVEVSVQIVKTFIHLRQAALSYSELDKRITKMEQTLDQKFDIIYHSISELMRETPSHDPKRKKIELVSTKNSPLGN